MIRRTRWRSVPALNLATAAMLAGCATVPPAPLVPLVELERECGLPPGETAWSSSVPSLVYLWIPLDDSGRDSEVACVENWARQRGMTVARSEIITTGSEAR